MLASMLKEHRRKRSEQLNQIDRKRHVAVKAIHRFNDKFLHSINSGVAVAYKNQRKLNGEMLALQSETQRFLKLSQNWMNDLNKFQTALKVSFLPTFFVTLVLVI